MNIQFRRVSTATAVAMSLTMSFSVFAQDVQQSTQSALPAQSLAQAIQEVARQTSINILVDPKLVEGRKAPALEARLSIDKALGLLLAGTGLTPKFVDEKTITLVSSREAVKTSASGSLIPSARGSEAINLAQTDKNDTPILTENTNTSSSPSSKEDGRAKIEEIVVTAQKRKESLKDVPIAITVLSGEKLDSSTTSVTDVLRSVPGIDTNMFGFSGGTTLSIRGVSNANPLFSGVGPVAYYMDSVPFGFVRLSFVPDSSVYDLQQIEVLRGPQGTLYGASALNGVVRVLTHDANPNKFEFKARTSLSTTEGGGGNYRGDLAVNVPIVEGKLAARAVVGYQNDSGWVDAPNGRDLNDAKLRNYRLKIHARPTDTLSIDLSAWHSESDIGLGSFSTDDAKITSALEQPITQAFDAYGIRINKEFSMFSVSSMTSYIDFGSFNTTDGSPAGVPLTLNTDINARIFSQELNFISDLDGPWRWSAGAFYRDAQDAYYQFYDFLPLGGPTAPANDADDSSESVAVYGEIGRGLYGNKLDVSVGLRYFRDEGRTIGNSVGTGVDFKAVSKATTPRAVLTWKPSSDRTVYLSYAQGFRSGFAQQPVVLAVVPDFPPAEPDKLTNYEMGTKGSVAGGLFSYEAALFYIDWQDIQQSLRVALPNGLASNGIVNGESASGVGAEFAVATRPFEGLELGVNGSWNDLTFDGDVITLVGAAPQTLFRKGDRLDFSPEYTVGAFAEYGFPLGGSGFMGRLSLSGNYKSPQNTTTFRVGTVESEDILIAGARFSIEASDHWRATLFADNLTNEYSTPNPSSDVPEWSLRFRPRTIGVQLEYRFD